MKKFIFALSSLFALFLVSCSDLQQDSSPIAPDFQKVSTLENSNNGTYDYLQCFDFIPVESVNTTKAPGSIDIVIAPDKFPKFFVHMFVVLEYNNYTTPVKNVMLYAGKPKINVIQLDNIDVKNLQSVKVYAFIPSANWKKVTPPYNFLTKFEELTVDSWTDNDNGIVIHTTDWKPNLGDTFVEIKLLSPTQANPVLTYIARPNDGKVLIPKFVKGVITQIKMYGFFNGTKY